MTGKQVETATELVTSSFFCVPRLFFLYYDVVYLATMQTTHICAQVRISFYKSPNQNVQSLDSFEQRKNKVQ